MKFYIEGVDRKSGKEVKGTIFADTEEHAIKQAVGRGIMIFSIKLHEEEAPSKLIQKVSTPPPASHREKYPALSVIQTWYYVIAAFNGLASGLIAIGCFANEVFLYLVSA